jgi:glycosyltransferase involved in cell wall biosynthesis
MDKVSVVIPTYNCERVIGRCLESLKWADEIVIIDSFSVDETVTICRSYTDRILSHEFSGYAQQKNWGIEHCAYDWILQMDSDEELEDGFAQEVQHLLQNPVREFSAYRCARKNHILGKWVSVAGLYPDYQVRFFNKAAGRFREREVHERLEVSGPVGTLKSHILHDGMPNLSKQIANLDRYTRLEANELRKNGKRFQWHQLFVRPTVIFADRYLRQRGILAGHRGLIVSVYLAFYSFLTYAKLWELQELNLDESPPT